MLSDNHDTLSSGEVRKLVELLNRLNPGFLPYDIFIQIARLVVLSIIEFVPLRLNEKGQVEVLLLPRSVNDDIWPGRLHTPGTVIRPTDDQADAYLPFRRIVDDELKGTVVGKPYFAGTIFHRSARGMEQSQVYWVEVLDRPQVGSFYPLDSLPDNLIDSQTSFIQQAGSSFKTEKLKNAGLAS